MGENARFKNLSGGIPSFPENSFISVIDCSYSCNSGETGIGPFLNEFGSEMGRIRFRRARFQTASTVSFLVLTEFGGRELSEFLSAYYLCAKANSPSFWQNSPSLPQDSVSSRFRNSTLETVFCPFTIGNNFIVIGTHPESGTLSCRDPGVTRPWKNKRFGMDIHDPKARTSMAQGGL